MRIDILTLFPNFFPGPFAESIIRQGCDKGLVSIYLHNIRDYAEPPANQVDDYAFGGGAGMILKIEPMAKALEAVLPPDPSACRLVLLSAEGKPYSQQYANDLAQARHLVIIAGHYKGMDERVRLLFRPEEISMGDFVLTGGEIPALALVDSVVRLIPGVVGDEESVRTDSFQNGLLDHPHYTRPRVYKDLTVPEVLLSGDHEKIRRWRRKKSLERTMERRPDLLMMENLSIEDRQLLEDKSLNLV
jgi:tRNA (guanine37-N1)-methyltransferase